VFLKCVEGKVSSGFDDLVVLADGQEANWEVVERILFIYAKLNPGHSYVQVIHVVVVYSQQCHCYEYISSLKKPNCTQLCHHKPSL